MMDRIEFLVQGSASEPYKVTFQHTGTNLTAYCTCPAGENGQYCKHRFRILNGETTGIVSKNVREVSLVASWLPGSDVELAIREVSSAEKEVEKATKVLSAAKKKLATTLRD